MSYRRFIISSKTLGNPVGCPPHVTLGRFLKTIMLQTPRYMLYSPALYVGLARHVSIMYSKYARTTQRLAHQFGTSNICTYPYAVFIVRAAANCHEIKHAAETTWCNTENTPVAHCYSAHARSDIRARAHTSFQCAQPCPESCLRVFMDMYYGIRVK